MLLVADTAGAVFRLAFLIAYRHFKLTRNKALEGEALIECECAVPSSTFVIIQRLIAPFISMYKL